jgi:hypothetical protein
MVCGSAAWAVKSRETFIGWRQAHQGEKPLDCGQLYADTPHIIKTKIQLTHNTFLVYFHAKKQYPI